MGLENFSGDVAGEAGENNNLAWHLVIGQALAEELEHGGGVESDAVVGGNEGEGLFALARVGQADDGGFAHAGKLVEDFFDLAWINIGAVDEEHVFAAIGDEEVTVVVAVADVAGEEPAAAKSAGGFLGLVPITEHDVGAAHTDFAGLARAENVAGFVLDGDFHIGNGEADGTGFATAMNGIDGNLPPRAPLT